jgi:alpha-galactosidase
MPIEWNAEARQLHLHNGRISHVIRVLDDGSLGTVHFGGPLAPARSYAHLPPRPFAGFSNRLGDPVALELPTPGRGDYRVPALVVEHPDGSTVLDLAYAGHRVVRGKPPIPGLPSTYTEDEDEAETAEIRLLDAPSGLEATLVCTIFRDLPAIARSLRLRNDGTKPLAVRCAMSASLDLLDARWEMLGLSGAWARERHVHARRLAPGRRSVSSGRGASGHEHNPFIALLRPGADETTGEAIGFSLVYSGNFLAEAEVDGYGTSRVRIGINPEGFAWRLDPGASFHAPEAVIAYSDAGIGGLSDTYHPLYRERLARGAWRDRPRPVLINNWEATYFSFDERKLIDIASTAHELGLELFVLDDGWFGARDDDTSSLGDWVVDRRKLPGGVDGVARKVEALGMRFGIWVEPEMVSARSRLFETHPDWAIGVPGRARTESRNQLVLDMSRAEVVDHLFGVLSDLLRGAPISYVKWDMNRNITEPYGTALPADRQGEFAHRYILGVYELYRRLTEAFPEVLFESCAGGGGRFDPGLLAFAPQGWSSDDTDAVERLPIQWGSSICYPLSSMGAHVSAAPNHQVGRMAPLAMRAAVAFFGVFGYELDPTTLSAGERAEIADQVAFYTRWRELLQRGRFLRLLGPHERDGNETAWMVVSADRRRAVVGHYRVLNRPNPGPRRLPLRGLDPAMRYRVGTWPRRGDGVERANERVRGGDELARVGLLLDTDRAETAAAGDFAARVFTLEAVDEPAVAAGSR